VLTDMEVLLVEPGKHRLGCGVVHFIGFLQVWCCVPDVVAIVTGTER